MLVRNEENTAGRDFVVGDLHGQYDLLQAELARVNFDRQVDRLIVVGDFIDRGARSYDCLELAFEPWVLGVRGNHEVLAKDALDAGGGQTWDLWMTNGGQWALTEDVREVKLILGEALRHLPFAREIPYRGQTFGIVHAEPPEDWGLLDLCGHAYREELLWARRKIKSGDTTPVSGIDAVMVGHTPVAEPAWLGNTLYLDTGAFATGKLTLLALDEIAHALAKQTDKHPR